MSQIIKTMKENRSDLLITISLQAAIILGSVVTATFMITK